MSAVFPQKPNPCMRQALTEAKMAEYGINIEVKM